MNAKKLVSLVVLLAFVVATFGIARPAAAQTAINPTLSVADQFVNAGDTFSVDVVLDTDGTGFTGWQFDYAWNPAAVELVSVVEGPFVRDWITSVGGSGTFFQAPLVNQAAGTLRGAAVTALGAPAGTSASGTGVIATMTFRALANGLSSNAFGGVILVLPGSVAYPGTIDLNSGSFQVGPAPRLVVTALGFTPIGTGEQFTVAFTVQNQGGLDAAASTAEVTATGATPATQSVAINALAAGASQTINLPLTYALDAGAPSALVTVSLPDFGTSRSATYSPTSAGGTTDVDATFGAYLEITPPALIEFNPLNIGGNDRFGDVNVKANTSYAVDVLDNEGTGFFLTKWDGTSFYLGEALTYPLIVRNNPQGLLVSAGTAARIINGAVAGQSGNAGENFPLVFNTTRDIADPLLPTGFSYHMILTWNAYITI